MHIQILRKIFQRTSVVFTLLAALLLSLLSFQILAAENALKDFKPPYGYKQFHMHYDVNADGTFKESGEITIKVYSELAVRMSLGMPIGDSPIPMAPRDRDIKIIAAYTLKKDGKHIAANTENPPPTGDQTGAPAVGPVAIPKIASFQNVEIGDELVMSYIISQKKPAYQDNILIDHEFPSFMEYDNVKISLSAPVALYLRIETSGIEKGESTVDGSIQKWVWNYQRKTTVAPTPNQLSARDKIHISTFKDFAAEMDAWKKKWEMVSRPPSAASAVSAAETIVAIAPTVNVQLSLGDQKIYDDSLNLINQFNGNGNQLETAYSMLVDLAKRNPKCGYPYAALADLKFRLASMGDGNYSDAYALTERAIRLDPDIADAYVVKAKVLIEQGEYLYAREAANKAIALAPNKPEAMFAMARTSEEWARVMIFDPTVSRAKWGGPEQLFGESERWYRKAIDTYQDNIRKSNIYFWLGNMLSNKIPRDITGAIEAFTKSAELAYNDSPWILNDIGRILITESDRYDQAIAYFEQALKIKDFEDARTNLGLAEFYKWGDAQQNPEKYKDAQRKPLAPAEITAKTGVTPEYALVMNAAVTAGPYASLGLLKKGFIGNVDIVPAGLAGTALINAAYANHLELAKQLIARKANVNYVDRDKRKQRTAIFYALQQHNFDMVKLLVNNGARLNLADTSGTPLTHFALAKYQASGKPAPLVLDYLLQHGADPSIPRSDGTLMLELAVSWDDIEIVRLLVNKYHAEVNTYIAGKTSSLLEGAKSVEVTEILLKAGANPWVKGMDSVDLVAKVMSPLNSDLSTKNKTAALILEARNRFPRPKDFGPEYLDQLIVEAVLSGDIEAVRVLVNKNHANVNAWYTGKPILEIAADTNKEVVEILLKGDANPWVKDENGSDIMKNIMWQVNDPGLDRPAIRQSAALILEARSRVSKPKNFGEAYQNQLILAAVLKGDIESMRKLVKKNRANLNQKYFDTSIIALAVNTNNKIVEILLEGGASPWVKNEYGGDFMFKIMNQIDERPNLTEIQSSAALILEARKIIPKPKDFGREYQSARR